MMDNVAGPQGWPIACRVHFPTQRRQLGSRIGFAVGLGLGVAHISVASPVGDIDAIVPYQGVVPRVSE